MFITPAFAQSATDTATGFGSGLEMIILFVPLMVVWYFLLIRPQRAQAKKREETLKAIRERTVHSERKSWKPPGSSHLRGLLRTGEALAGERAAGGSAPGASPHPA